MPTAIECYFLEAAADVGYVAETVARKNGKATSIPQPGQNLKWRDDFEAA